MKLYTKLTDDNGNAVYVLGLPSMIEERDGGHGSRLHMDHGLTFKVKENPNKVRKLLTTVHKGLAEDE